MQTRKTIEEEHSYGEIIKAIYEGHTTLYSMSSALNKYNATLIQQLSKLQKKNYIIKEKDIASRGAKNYRINKKALIEYWSSKYPGLNKQRTDQQFDIWFKEFLFILTSVLNMKDFSIDSLGGFMNKRSEPTLSKIIKLIESEK
jgi:hypothetical protein